MLLIKSFLFLKMKISPDCIPCFFRQADEITKRLNLSKYKKKKVFDEIAKAIPRFSLNITPPLVGRFIHNIVKKIAQKDDPYLEIKKRSNELALSLYPYLKRKLNNVQDRLKEAIKFSIAGNIIDYGVNSVTGDGEMKKKLEEILERKKVNKKFFRYAKFKKSLKKAKSILYLADNAGEVVFDKILIEEIRRIYPQKLIFYAVREKPIINDALADDAYFCGINKFAEVLSSGCDAPGTILSLCSNDFLKIYKNADLIISKGQGNFETLWGKEKIFFLFMVKCDVVAKEVKCPKEEIMLLPSIS